MGSDLLCQGSHVAERFVWHPGPTVVVVIIGAVIPIPAILPAIVDHQVWPVLQPACHLLQIRCILQHLLPGGVPVRIVPVVGAVDGLSRQQGIVAHRPAELSRSRKGRHTLVLPAHHLRRRKRSAGEQDTLPATSHVQVQRHTLLVQLPAADSPGAYLYAVPCHKSVLLKQHVPWQHLSCKQVLPAKVRVGPLPGIPKHMAHKALIKAPAKPDAAHRRNSGREIHGERVPLFLDPHLDISKEEAPHAFSCRCFTVHSHHIRHPLDPLKHVIHLPIWIIPDILTILTIQNSLSIPVIL